MQLLYDIAAQLNVQVEYADLNRLDRDGDYNHRSRTIRLQQGMLYRLERSVLAHELAHAVHGDERTIFGYLNQKIERRADEWAARTLIDIREYQTAEIMYGSDTEALAHELQVMPWIIDAYKRTLQRIGDTVYLNPKYGAGSWTEKLGA